MKQKIGFESGLDSSSGQRPVAVSCEHCNEPSGSIKGRGITWPSQRILAPQK